MQFSQGRKLTIDRVGIQIKFQEVRLAVEPLGARQSNSSQQNPMTVLKAKRLRMSKTSASSDSNLSPEAGLKGPLCPEIPITSQPCLCNASAKVRRAILCAPAEMQLREGGRSSTLRIARRIYLSSSTSTINSCSLVMIRSRSACRIVTTSLMQIASKSPPEMRVLEHRSRSSRHREGP